MFPDVEATEEAAGRAFARYLDHWSEVAATGRPPTAEERGHLAALQERVAEAHARWKEARAEAGLPVKGLELPNRGGLEEDLARMRRLFGEAAG